MNTPRIDSHQHFWQLQRGDYDWLSPDLGPLYRDYQPPELATHLRTAGIDQTILVQAATSVAETDTCCRWRISTRLSPALSAGSIWTPLTHWRS